MKKKTMAVLAVLFILGVMLSTMSFRTVAKAPNEDCTRTTEYGYTNKKIVSGPPVVELEEIEYDPLMHVASELMDLPEYAPYHGTKTYECYNAITNRGSKAYKLEAVAETDEYGFRKLDGRYLVAIGTHFCAPAGTYIDIYLDDWTCIPAIVGDIKSDKHTDDTNTYTVHSKCATEFIVDGGMIRKHCNGDVSSVFPEWKQKVSAIRVYQYNYFTDGPAN